MSIDQISLGRVIEISGQKFAKVKNDPNRGSQFMAITIPAYCTFRPSEGMMQSWTGCSALATPTATNFTQGPCLTDSRDGKKYEIRKFADGKCWMVDNLMYGGAVDNCAGKGAADFTNGTYGGANGMASPSNRFGTGTYGNCRDPRVGGSSPCTAGSTTCGYYYNWQAVMQHSSAYFNTTYTGPTANVQGICPSGWHVISGDATGEIATLDKKNGGTGTSLSSCATAACNFWRPGFAYKGVYSGNVAGDGIANNQGLYLRQWLASVSGWEPTLYVYYLGVDTNLVPGTSSGSRYFGFTVRCIKN